MRTRGEAGMTLMEVMVTMVLLTVALLGLALAFPPAGAVVFQGRVITRAVGLAEERLETARRTPYADLPGLAGADATTYAPYTVVTAVTVDAPAAGLTTVTVTVTGPVIQGPYLEAAGPQDVVVESFFSQA